MLHVFQLGGFGRGGSQSVPGGGGGGGSHRYWRFVGIAVPGGGFLEVSELQLFEGATQATGATLSSSSAPVFGAVADLADDNLSTRCYWTEAVAEDSAFWIQFDLGAGNDRPIDGFKQGGFDEANRCIEGCTLEFSDNASSWTALGSVSGLTYPGNFTLSALIPIP